MASNLSDQQIRSLRDKLKERDVQLREEIGQQLLKYDNQQYIDLAGRVHDSGEESVANLLVDVNFADIDRDVREVRDIDAALLRIAEGSYGECIDCGNPIGFERLQAYTTAKRCIHCQTLYEQTRGQEKPPSL